MMLRYRTWLAGAVVALAFSAPVSLHAQVVVIANGSPITEYDIQQRMKLEAISQKTPNRQQVITDLIDDRLKIARAKVYGLEIGDSDINGAFENMATRQHITIAQFSQVLERAGISPNTVKARIRAEMDKVIVTTGFKGDFKAFIAMLRSDPRFYYKKPEDLIEGYRALKERATTAAQRGSFTIAAASRVMFVDVFTLIASDDSVRW